MSLISQAAKRLKTLLATTAGAAQVGFDAGLTYAAGTVGAVIKSLQSSITTLSGQIAGILDGATFTGPVSLPGNASDNLHAVPLQQLNAVVAAIPAAVGSYAPAFYQWRDLAILSPTPDTWVTLYGGVFQAYRGGWPINGTGVTVKAPGFMKVSVVGVDMSASAGNSVLMRVKHNGDYIKPEATYKQGEQADGLFVIVPVAVGDTLNVAIKASVGSDVATFGCASLTYEYFGPVS